MPNRVCGRFSASCADAPRRCGRVGGKFFFFSASNLAANANATCCGVQNFGLFFAPSASAFLSALDRRRTQIGPLMSVQTPPRITFSFDHVALATPNSKRVLSSGGGGDAQQTKNRRASLHRQTFLVGGASFLSLQTGDNLRLDDNFLPSYCNLPLAARVLQSACCRTQRTWPS